MSSKKIKMLVTAALFVALDIIVARFLGFELVTPLGPVKFDFQVVVAALCGYALGPLWAALTLVSSDLLGALLNGGSLGLFLGFTLSALLRGLLFGFLLHNKKPRSLRLILSVAIVFITVDWSLNTVWLSIMLGTPFFPLWLSRLIPKIVLMILEMALILFLPTLFSIIGKNLPAPLDSKDTPANPRK